MKKIKWILFLLCSGFIVSCNGSGSDSSSVLRLKLPTDAQVLQGQGALDGGKSCFAIDIAGGNIPSTPGTTCDPTYGQLQGTFSAGQEIELFVPKGKKLNFSLYFFQSQTGCTFFQNLEGVGRFGSTRVHRLALKEGVDVIQPEADIKLPISPPEASNTLETLFNFPESCRGDKPPIQTRVRLARFAAAAGSSRMSDGGRIFLRMGEKAVQSKNINEDVELLPVGLGESQ